MRIIVTGAAGYVGSHAVAELRRRGHELLALARDGAQAEQLGALGLDARIAPLEDPAALAEAARGADAVLHAAASDDPAFLPVNDRAVAALLDALPDGAAFVTHGGTLVYGDTGPVGLTAAAPTNPPPFLAGRVALEGRILEAGGRLRTAVVHAALAYGGKGAVIPALLAGATRRLGAAPLLGAGTNGWASVHVSDWARLLADAVERTPAAGTRYVAAGRIVTLAEVSATLAAEAGFGLPRPLPMEEATALLGPFAQALTLEQRFLPGPERDLLGWSPRIDDLPAGLREALSA